MGIFDFIFGKNKDYRSNENVQYDQDKDKFEAQYIDDEFLEFQNNVSKSTLEKFRDTIRMHSNYSDDSYNKYGYQLLVIYQKYGKFLGEAEDEAREIGNELNKSGGFEAMKMVCETIYHVIGGIPGRHLEKAWDGIGRWLG